MTQISGQIPHAVEAASTLSRRDFLKRAAGASALALGASGLCAALYDPRGPASEEETAVLDGLGSFALPDFSGERGKMAILRGTDRAAMLERAMAALGGLESFIRKGDRVLIKVNAAFATSPALGATTHPDLLAAMTRMCMKAGAAQVLVTDNPINNPEGCFALTGLNEAARASGARIVKPANDLFVPVSLPGGRLIRNWPVMAGALRGVTKVVAMAPVKDHHRAGASMSLKNFYGFLGGRRNVFHQDINTIITELSLLIRPTLVVLDGVVSMMTNGPTGGSLSDLKATNTLIVSTDPVAADGAGLELLGRTPEEVPYIRMAEEAGAGLADYSRLHPVRIDMTA